MYITHINIHTGRLRRSTRDQVPDAAVLAAQSWIFSALSGGQPLPMSWAGPYHGTARIEHGGLLVTVYSETALPVLTIRVALRTRHAALWPASETNARKPQEPWSNTTVVTPEALPAPADLIVIEDALMWAWKEMRTAAAGQ